MIMNWVRELAQTDDWKMAMPVVVALLRLQAVDIVMGVLTSVHRKRLCSTIGWRGFTRKVGTILIVISAGIIDPLLPFNLTMGAALAYCGWEVLSLVEKAGLLGIPIPENLKEAMKRLRDADEKNEPSALVNQNSQSDSTK